MKTFIQAFRLLIFLSLLTGILYPAGITLAAKILFPHQASGSLIRKDGKLAGSELLAQKFISSHYFWPRPSASDYGAVPSGASNLGPTSAALQTAVKERAVTFQQAHGSQAPADMIFASGSGLDPHISPKTAKLQAVRVAQARGIAPGILEKLIDEYTEGPQFFLWGESRVNVIRLNVALDETAPQTVS